MSYFGRLNIPIIPELWSAWSRLKVADNTGARVVDVELKPDSRKALADFTRERVGKRIQLRSNGILLSSATLMSPLEGDSFRITAALSSDVQ